MACGLSLALRERSSAICAICDDLIKAGLSAIGADPTRTGATSMCCSSARHLSLITSGAVGDK
jgi:hypothetical protein